MRIVILALAACTALGACAQTKTVTTSVPQSDWSDGQGTRITNSEPGLNTAQQQPGMDGQQPDNSSAYNPDNNGYDTGSNNRVRVRAPFVNLNVDRGTGAVHIRAPFVHVDKRSYGQSTNVDVSQ